MSVASAPPTAAQETITAGISLKTRLAAYLALGSAVLWAFLSFRWLTFGAFDWQATGFELALAQWPAMAAYLIYGLLLLTDAAVGVGLLREMSWAKRAGLIRAAVSMVAGLAYFLVTREFVGASAFLAIAGLLLVLLIRDTAWALAYPAGYFLFIFFILPNLIVLVVSLGDRARLGTITYPAFDLANLGAYFDDYARFFSRIGGELIYLRILGRSFLLALLNTLICLLFGYPFAYWIARQPVRLRNAYVFLVMIPFWTNFLVRTYAWMLILRDSGIINNFWTITLHEQAVQLAGDSGFFAWLAAISESKLPLLFNTPAVLVGLFYGFLPFMILPLYASLDKLDWSLLEAAADLGAGRWKSITRVLLPLTAPGIAAGSIIVFIPSLGAYVTPDLMGGAKVALVGNLLQQQFMTVRDWPFGSAIGFILMAVMLLAIIIYFRVSTDDNRQAL